MYEGWIRTISVLGGVLLGSSVASAHIRLDAPARRAYGDDQKNPPCGRAAGERTDVVTTFAPGETITVSWYETIGHPGYFRVAFDVDGEDDFVNPPEIGASHDYSSAVLLDNIDEWEGLGFLKPEELKSHSVQVTLPNVECDNCTLQVIQLMDEPRGEYSPTNNAYFYYQCANIILTADPNNPPDPDAGVNPGTDAGTATDGGVSPGIDAGGNSGDDSGTGLPTTDAGTGGVGGTPGASEGSDDGGCSVSSSRGRSGLGLFVALLGFFFIRRRRPLASR